jgi:hypothetical protein
LVPLYVDGHQVVSLSVAAYATDVGIDDRGYVDLPHQSGNEFRPLGVPWTSEVGIPLAPEEAVASVGLGTEAKIKELPTLLAPGKRFTAHTSRWVLVLDRPIQVITTASGATLSVTTVYVSEDLRPSGDYLETFVRWWVASPTQPLVDSTVGDNVPILPDRPIDFLEVLPDQRSTIG